MEQELVEIRLLGLVVQHHIEASQHIAELVRELVHLRDSGSDVPRRLLALRDEIRGRHRSLTAGGIAEIEEAAAQGVPVLDVVVHVPAHTREVATRSIQMLDEADEFCRAGSLLTLGASDRVTRYRHWFFGEFVRQIDGRPPTAWADGAARA